MARKFELITLKKSYKLALKAAEFALERTSSKMRGARGLIWLLVFGVAAVLGKLDDSLLTEESKKLFANIHKTCVSQVGIQEAQIEKLKAAVFEDDEKSKCYVKCVMSESGVMDEHGEIDMSAMAEVIPEKIRQKTKGTMEGCVNHGDGIENPCEKAYAILQCVQQADPENYFFV